MFPKAFFIYSVVMGGLLVGAGLFFLFFNPAMRANLGATKVNLLGGAAVGYGLFRIWRAFKMNKPTKDETNQE